MSEDTHHDTPADFEQELHAHDEWFRHTPDEPAHQEMHGQLNPYAIMAFLLVTIVVVFATAGLVHHTMTLRMTNHLKMVRQEAKTDTTLAAAYREAHATWERELTTSGWVDRSNGVVRLPVEVAAEKVRREYRSGMRN